MDEGQWINLKDGKIYKTKNFRPYRASKYIKAGNTSFKIINIPEMFIYPGDLNPRVRWEGIGESEDVNENILQKVLSYASDNYTETLKGVKTLLRIR